MTDREAVSTRTAGKMLGVSYYTVQAWVDNGRLEAWKTRGGHRRIPVESIERILQERGTAQAARLSARGKKPTDTARCPTVLVIENDPDLLLLCKIHIYTVLPHVRLLSASNGFEGLLKMGENPPELLIIDLAMPGMDGLRMLRTLDSQGTLKNLRVAVITGLGEEEIALQGGLPEQVILLRKPVDFERLRALAAATQAKEEGKRGFRNTHPPGHPS